MNFVYCTLYLAFVPLSSSPLLAVPSPQSQEDVHCKWHRLISKTGISVQDKEMVTHTISVPVSYISVNQLNSALLLTISDELPRRCYI